MNSDKQIEEMAKVIENGINICAKKPCEDCDFCGADDCMCQNLVIAKELHTAGYRKIHDDHQRQCACYALGCQMAESLKSDVAREVIDEINDSFDQMVNEAENTIMNAIQEGNLTAARIARYGKDVIILARNTLTKMLEKKYTEGEG